MVSGGDRGARNRIRTGIALSATELCAFDVRLRGDDTRTWRIALEPQNGDNAWPSLASAFRELARELGVSNGSLVVSLMPPLVEARRLELPPLREEELQRLLTRNASRYFVNARGPQVVGASPIGRPKRGAVAPVVAAAASARVVAAVHAAAEQSGWIVENIVPAEGAWASAARKVWPAFARDDTHLIVAQPDRTDVLHLNDGRLAGVRRFRGGAADAAAIADIVRPMRAGIIGSVEARRQLASSLESLGVHAVMRPDGAAPTADRADLLAAQFAGEASGPVLRTEGAASVDRARVRKLAVQLCAAAAVLLVISAAIDLWGVRRQLRQVREQRAALRGRIAATLVGRTTIDATYRQVAALNTIELAAPRWSAVIANLSAAIPRDAYLTAIRTRQDSIVVDGLGEHAGRVFDALTNTPGLTGVHAAAPVRREAQDEGPALEHFTIAARAEAPRERPSTASPVLSGHPRSTKP